VRARGAEQALTGTTFSPNAVEQAARLVTEGIAPISDVRSTAEYRRDMAAVISRDAVLTAWRRAGGEAAA
jgi:carbon-monoxide dehydrogenase medium subunit